MAPIFRLGACCQVLFRVALLLHLLDLPKRPADPSFFVQMPLPARNAPGEGDTEGECEVECAQAGGDWR